MTWHMARIVADADALSGGSMPCSHRAYNKQAYAFGNTGLLIPA